MGCVNPKRLTNRLPCMLRLPISWLIHRFRPVHMKVPRPIIAAVVDGRNWTRRQMLMRLFFFPIGFLFAPDQVLGTSLAAMVLPAMIGSVTHYRQVIFRRYRSRKRLRRTSVGGSRGAMFQKSLRSPRTTKQAQLAENVESGIFQAACPVRHSCISARREAVCP